MKIVQDYFRKFDFKPEDIKRYLRSALRDLEIAEKDKFPEVKFTYSYQALIKTGIALLAKVRKLKVRSVPGHHVKILDEMGEILKREDVVVIGNAMRMKRNADLYGGGEIVGEKETDDYFKFVQTVIAEAGKKIGNG
ncbi:MAG: hypothetical protein JW893_00350 [Candidatus Omnitrophica bacterium]|nr:hypothetical protein [Candidatus Omnitrophota bacterium]